MNRIIPLIGIIVVTLGVFLGATGAFFSDSESSLGNVFTAGAIDLMVENESYYNGAPNPATSWTMKNLGSTEKFFDFDDVKPGDYGEDTISLRVETNPSYICANVTLTSNDDNGLTEPESLVDSTGGIGEGELASLINFMWWADDGDNVLEDDEVVISQGPIGALTLGDSHSIALADSSVNIWDGSGPFHGNETRAIGKAWCFGALTASPLPQDNSGTNRTPKDDNDNDSTPGTPKDGGFTCDGSALGNESQSDSLTADISFSAVQARHNEGFLCNALMIDTTSLTLKKTLFASAGASESASDWTLSASGPATISGKTGESAVTHASITPGTYTLSETGPSGYSASSWICVGGTQTSANTINIAEGEQVSCEVVNYQACDANQAYADTVHAVAQGVQKNGGGIPANRSNPLSALGAPQSTGSATDGSVPAGSFFSLGFATGTNTDGGTITLRFGDNYIIDGAGDDLRLFEVTQGTYPDERVRVEVSQDGALWKTVATSTARDSSLDMAGTGFAWASYVRVTDVSNRALFEGIGDGYDLDAIQALHCAVRD